MPADSRRVITASVVLLAVGLVGASTAMALNAYRELIVAQRAVRIDAMVGELIRATGQMAFERGLTAAALGAGGVAGADTHRDIARKRRDADATWNDALAIAREIAAGLPAGSNFSAALEHAADTHRMLEEARARVDRDLRTGGRPVGLGQWIAAVRSFIEDAMRLHEMAHDASITSMMGGGQTLATLHARVWTMSEYAGLERGTLAFYIGTRRPIPPVVLEELENHRAIVEHAERALTDMLDLPALDLRLKQAIASMKQEYSGRFERTRRAVYGAARSGRYPVSGAQWMTTATAAIDYVLAVATMSFDIAREKTQQAEARNRRLLALYALLFALAVTFALVVVMRVRRVADALFHEKELSEATLHSIGDAVITTDTQGNVDSMNPIAETLTGWSLGDARGRPLREVFRVVDGITRESRVNPVEKCLEEDRIVGLENNTVLIGRDGVERVIEDSAAPVRDREGKIAGAVMIFYDVTPHHATPHLLSYQATHDALTDLANRREFERRLTALVESARSGHRQHVLLYLDLDQFKLINDTCGHVAGDQLLRQIAFLLKNRLRDTDLIARLGGDEFGVLLESCPPEPALQIANGLVRAVSDFRFVWQDTTFEIGASIGLIPITAGSGNPTELLRDADSACYVAKDKGRNRVQAYEAGDAALRQRADEMQWVPRLRDALENDRFVLYCHTILPLNAGAQGNYCETLVRLIDEEGGIVPPMAFLPAAERYNLMPAIDRWIIRQALALFGKRGGAVPGGGNTHCFINLSAVSLMDEKLPDFIREQLRLNEVPPGSVCFEITETSAVAHLEIATAFMKSLKEDGCKFALDDFGAGMSSFSYLKNLPVDYLKIDGALVRQIAESPTDCAMVDAINRVGHVMGLATIAEYVENDAILQKLRGLGVDYAQGFGIAEPRPMEGHLAAATPAPAA